MEKIIISRNSPLGCKQARFSLRSLILVSSVFISCFTFVHSMSLDGKYEIIKSVEIERLHKLRTCPQEVYDFMSPLVGDCGSMFNLEPEVEAINIKDICRRRMEIPILDFSEYTFGEIVASLMRILQSKLDARNSEIKYETKYAKFQNIDNSDVEEGKGEGYLDPYYAKIRIKDRNYNFSLCYNGQSKQVGNSVIRESRRGVYFTPGQDKIRGHALQWYQVPNGSDLEKLLLALEIARRKVKDCGRADEYSDLPIACAIAIAKALNMSRPDTRCFSGDKEQRESVIKNLIGKYCADNRVADNKIKQKMSTLVGRLWKWKVSF